MTSGNRSDVKEDAYRYVGVTDIQKGMQDSLPGMCCAACGDGAMLYEAGDKYHAV